MAPRLLGHLFVRLNGSDRNQQMGGKLSRSKGCEPNPADPVDGDDDATIIKSVIRHQSQEKVQAFFPGTQQSRNIGQRLFNINQPPVNDD